MRRGEEVLRDEQSRCLCGAGPDAPVPAEAGPRQHDGMVSRESGALVLPPLQEGLPEGDLPARAQLGREGGADLNGSPAARLREAAPGDPCGALRVWVVLADLPERGLRDHLPHLEAVRLSLLLQLGGRAERASGGVIHYYKRQTSMSRGENCNSLNS